MNSSLLIWRSNACAYWFVSSVIWGEEIVMLPIDVVVCDSDQLKWKWDIEMWITLVLFQYFLLACLLLLSAEAGELIFCFWFLQQLEELVSRTGPDVPWCVIYSALDLRTMSGGWSRSEGRSRASRAPTYVPSSMLRREHLRRGSWSGSQSWLIHLEVMRYAAWEMTLANWKGCNQIQSTTW